MSATKTHRQAGLQARLVLMSLGTYSYTYEYDHDKKIMNLKENKEGYLRGLGGKKGKRKMMLLKFQKLKK